MTTKTVSESVRQIERRLCWFSSCPYFNLVPRGTSSKKLASTGFPPSSDAATIIPFDSSPRSLRGARFATITTLRPINVLWRVSLGDPGNELPHFTPKINLQPQQLIRALHSLRHFHQRHPQLNLREIVDADFAVRNCRSRLGRSARGRSRRGGAGAAVVAAVGAAVTAGVAVVAVELFCSSIFCILSTADLSARGNTGFTRRALFRDATDPTSSFVRSNF